jgi:acetoin utilization protein AcuB
MRIERRMKRDVVTVRPADTFLHAMHLIRDRGIRHLPVVEGRQVVGIVTDRDIRQASVSPASHLNTSEAQALLDKVTVAEIMSKPAIIIDPDDTVEEAARRLLKHRIGGLPVVRDGQLVGIITETDVLEAFLDVMGITETSGRLELVVEDRPDPEAFREVCRAIADQGADIASVVAARAAHQGRDRKVLIFRVEAPDFDALIAHLKAAGFPVLSAAR